MEYINIPLYVIRSNEYIGADPTQRATWLSLIAWSCDQENMGRIAGARSWGDRRWMQSCGVMASEVAESCGLFRWDGDDLVISFYPADAQREIERKREIARANGRKGGRKPTPEPIPETNVGSDVGTQPWIANEAPLESEKKGKEKKGNIGGETTTVDSTPGEEVPAAPVLPAQSFPNRERLNDVRGMRCADNHADLGASPGAARFMAACLEINPSWSRTMPTAIEQAAALEAYCSAQGRVTPRDMEMLRDYYASGLTEDCKKKAFWRPDSRRKFWECFGDVLTHADRWAKETRWKPASARKKPKPEEPRQPEGPVVDVVDAAAEIASLREEMGIGGDE
nr:MAG TPA: hypothetical protein [Caudoviricetes sp.]